MNYIELSFTVTPKSPFTEILIAQLNDLGFDSFTESEIGFSAFIQQNLYSKAIAKCISEIEMADAFFSFEEKLIPSKNWNERWEENYQPILVSEKCMIRAPFHKRAENIFYDIIIEPKMAFGTGHHETTVLMVETILFSELREKKVLDVGSGSGVLAILAGKMNAKKVRAIDIDEWAYSNTLENITLNNLCEVTVQKGIVDDVADRFDVIFANINKNILLADMKKYCNLLSSKGQLLMSGFFETDLEDIRSEASKHKLVLKGYKSKNNWVAANFEKNESEF